MSLPDAARARYAGAMRLVLCNVPPDRAADLARTLVQERLAACVNALHGGSSTYVWDGALCTDAETTLLIKTTDDRVDALRERLVALHPYTLPEVIVLAVDTAASHAPYLDWVVASTRPQELP